MHVNNKESEKERTEDREMANFQKDLLVNLSQKFQFKIGRWEQKLGTILKQLSPGVDFINPFMLYAKLLRSGPNFWEAFLGVKVWRRA